MASLLLAFYSSITIQLYQDAYMASITLRSENHPAVLDGKGSKRRVVLSCAPSPAQSTTFA